VSGKCLILGIAFLRYIEYNVVKVKQKRQTMKTTFYLNEIGRVRDFDDETSIRKAVDFEFEFIGCPSVDTTELRAAMISYRDSLNNHDAPDAIYQKRSGVERKMQIIYKHIYEAMP
jgi:hypothetical protein